MGDGNERGLRSNLGVGMEFANAVLYSLSSHPRAVRGADGIVLPIDNDVWCEVFDREFPHKELLKKNRKRIQALSTYCHNYFNRGRNGIGYDKSGNPDFGEGDRDVDPSMGKMGKDIRKSSHALHPGNTAVLSADEVIDLAINYWSEFQRSKSLPAQPATSRLQADIDQEAAELLSQGYFDAAVKLDARKRVLREIVQRYGQASFRNALLDVYGGRCVVTGCDAIWALESAHVVPYRGAHTNHVTNGLLVRCDIHTLFDLNLLGIHPETHRLHIASELDDTSYRELRGRILPYGQDGVTLIADKAALAERWELFRALMV